MPMPSPSTSPTGSSPLARMPHSGTENPVHPAFECLRRVHVPTLNVMLEEYRHKITG